ncbi:carboxypeptidase-like regulatory domain-containing protein [Hymenobacter cellulosilyticus]|uniref:Carboxypeptidase-like regulatory domain-containing protein n=1 Tax=Hymenobacter cellulosilyticus TaxID=2932248 RepID=A0A8T9Q996_9BACT|nr:carboxypeptidase-like regulatory domain-containing protein [Hymenobacter cellulosilyticus]UOQ71533.1 carboxypeptidase-like regulatory domain-containing protein [Hymenobacter cellulosilyticus]
MAFLTRLVVPLLFLVFCARPAAAQHRVVSGQVVEAATGEPVPFASVFIPKTSTGTTADLEGRFKLALSGAADSIAASALGFVALRQPLSAASEQSVLFRLKPDRHVLAEVMVYSRQPENPAFRILREVQKHKPRNARHALQAAEYDSYNRIETSLLHVPQGLARRKVVRDIRALAQRQGAAAAADPDAPLPLFASEVSSRVYQTYAPLRRREDLLHRQMRGPAPGKARWLPSCWAPTFRTSTSMPTGSIFWVRISPRPWPKAAG